MDNARSYLISLGLSVCSVADGSSGDVVTCRDASVTKSAIATEFLMDASEAARHPVAVVRNASIGNSADDAMRDHRTSITIIGPVLGSMESKAVVPSWDCDGDALELRATIIRDARYPSSFLKNVPWRPRFDLTIVLKAESFAFALEFNMVSSDGAPVRRARKAPADEIAYPIDMTCRISVDSVVCLTPPKPGE